MNTFFPKNALTATTPVPSCNHFRYRVTALLTSFNRKAHTLECLTRLELAALNAGVAIDGVLVDDASTDGTAEAVAEAFPWMKLERGDGSLYWNRGMHRAQAISLHRGADFLLWINDDTMLVENALQNLMRTHDMLRTQLGRKVIVVGATADGDTGALTYGGSVSTNKWRRFTYRKVWHALEPTECNTMNGNLVLLPTEIARAVGNLDPVFEHAMGDIDYALRARKLGYRIFVAPGFAGFCSHNSRAGTFLDNSLPFTSRWRQIMSRKGLPPRSWAHFTRKHGGLAWPIYFAWPYLRLIVAELLHVRSKVPREAGED